MPTPKGYSSSSPYASSGAPSSMYMGVTPYTASPFNGTSMPPYEGSAYNYNYNSHLPGGNPLQLSTTPAYSVGPMIGTGTTAWILSRRAISKEKWKCQFLLQNMRKCNTPKPGSQVAKPAKSSESDLPEGSWKCDKCNNINYPFRTKCNRQNCGADKPLESHNSPTEEENK